MSVVLPAWIDQVPGVDFGPEKTFLRELEDVAASKGWAVSNGSTLPTELRERTDVLLTAPDGTRQMRVAVLPKSKRSAGAIRIDADRWEPFSHRVFELIYQPKLRRWRLEASTIPLLSDFKREDWDQLAEWAFDP